MKTLPKFCSQKCNGKNRSENKKGPTENFTGDCKQCGKNFSTYKAPSRSEPKYCSIKCIGLAQLGSNNPAYNGGRYKDSNGYIVIYMPYHPYGTAKKTVYEHRYIMECKIGRYLKEEEVVHHIDGDRSNNRIENLTLFNNQSEHIKHHKGEN